MHDYIISQRQLARRALLPALLVPLLAACLNSTPATEPTITRVEPPTIAPSPTVAPTPTPDLPVGTGYWHARGAQLVDEAGSPVRITGINWYGFEDGTMVPHGLGFRDYRALMDQVKELGYNTIRLPYTSTIVGGITRPSGVGFAGADLLKPEHSPINADLKGLSSLEVLDKIVAYAGEIGLKIILDRHRPNPVGQSALWYSADVTEEQWIADWQTLARRYLGQTQVLGADLHNEPHETGDATTSACWGCGDPKLDWKAAAQRAGDAILAINPDWLIIVEGIGHNYVTNTSYWWGGNHSAAMNAPLRLAVPGQLVYSIHDYPLSIWDKPGHPWFFAPNYPDNLDCVWDHYWGYIASGLTCSTGREDFSGDETRSAIPGWEPAPVLVGEFGTRLQNPKDDPWLRAMTRYLGAGAGGISWTFWVLNPDSGGTGGILKNDWMTVEAEKQALLAPIQFQLEWAGEARAATPER